jgi:hypothetical protein
MSTKRARYTGPYDEVTIQWPPGEIVPEKTWTVKQNHWLPDDAPAKLRDELLQSDDWSEIEQPADIGKKKED